MYAVYYIIWGMVFDETFAESRSVVIIYGNYAILYVGAAFQWWVDRKITAFWVAAYAQLRYVRQFISCSLKIAYRIDLWRYVFHKRHVEIFFPANYCVICTPEWYICGIIVKYSCNCAELFCYAFVKYVFTETEFYVSKAPAWGGFSIRRGSFTGSSIPENHAASFLLRR